MDERARRTMRARAVGLAATLLVPALLLHAMRDYALLGWDTYPLILASRVSSPADLWGNLSEKLMDIEHFSKLYRPVSNLSLALDHALWGLAPFGFILTNVLLFAGCALVLHLLAARLVGRGAVLAPILAGLVFVLFPLQFEAIPSPARRPELLCCLFAALALHLQLAPRGLASARPPLAPAALMLLAMGSKETGLVLPSVAFVAVLLYSPREGAARRLAHALRATIPHAVALGIVLAARFAVLDTLGGHPSTRPTSLLAEWPGAASELVRALAFPQELLGAAPFATALLPALGLGLAATLLLRARDRGERDAPSERTPWRAAAVAASWILAVAAIYGATGSILPWYLLVPSAGWALLVAALAEGCVDALRRGGLAVRAAALPTLALLACLLVLQARYAPIFHRYDEWERATVASRAFLEDLERGIERAPEGANVLTLPRPGWVRPSEGEVGLRSVSVLTHRSVVAWTKLRFPDRVVRVRGPDTASHPPPAEGIRVVLSPPSNDF